MSARRLEPRGACSVVVVSVQDNSARQRFRGLRAAPAASLSCWLDPRIGARSFGSDGREWYQRRKFGGGGEPPKEVKELCSLHSPGRGFAPVSLNGEGAQSRHQLQGAGVAWLRFDNSPHRTSGEGRGGVGVAAPRGTAMWSAAGKLAN